MSAQEKKQQPARPYTRLPHVGPLFPKPLRRDELVDRHGKPLFPTQAPYREKPKEKDQK